GRRWYDRRRGSSRFFPGAMLGAVEAEREDETEVAADVVEAVPDAASGELVRETPRALARPATGGVVVYAAVAGAASVVPVPFVDAFLAKLARGSAMRRVAARRGVRLTPEGRAVLARPGLSSPLGSAPARLLRS